MTGPTSTHLAFEPAFEAGSAEGELLRPPGGARRAGLRLQARRHGCLPYRMLVYVSGAVAVAKEALGRQLVHPYAGLSDNGYTAEDMHHRASHLSQRPQVPHHPAALASLWVVNPLNSGASVSMPSRCQMRANHCTRFRACACART